MTAYAKLRALTEPRQADVGQTFHRLADLLRESGEQTTVRFTLLTAAGDGERGRWTLGPNKRRYRVLEGDAAGRPDVEIVTREATWWEIAEGRLSPLDAFVQGRLRLLGDTGLASRLLRAASGDAAGTVALCGE